MLLITIALWVVCFISIARAGTQEYSWAPVQGATSYKVYQSTDHGVTWTLLGETTSPNFNATLADDKLILVRVSTVSGTQESIRLTSGFFYDRTQDKTPISLTVK